jgi:NADH-quinone oxidoreductase subunit L
MFMTFYGKYRGDHHTWDHAHESPPVILIPLYVLAVGAALSGLVAYGWFVGHDWMSFWGSSSIAVKSTEEVLHHAHEVPVWVKLMPLVFALSGIALSYYYYLVGGLRRSPRRFPRLYALFYGKWYFDEIYDRSSCGPPSPSAACSEEGRRRDHRQARPRQHSRPRPGRRAC